MVSELSTLLAKQAIAEVLYRYCRGCDRADEQTLRSCFHPGSRHSHGGFNGSSEDFCTLALSIVKPLRACKHILSNVLVEVDGERAVSESHYFAYQRVAKRDTGVEQDYFTGGRYLDRFEYRNGEWRIVSRVGLIDFERYSTAVGDVASVPADLRSGKYPDDELYRLFGGKR